MQPQLEEGEFCPPDYPTVICKAGPRVVWVGQRKSGFTGRCSVTMRANESALAAATRKLNQLKDKAGSSDAPADASRRPGTCVEEQQPAATEEQQPSATEVLVWRPKRQRQVPDFLQPCDALREFATGSRKRGRQQSDDERCTKRACECAAVSAERDDYKQRCEEQAAAHMRLREEVSAIARDAAGGDSSAATAVSAMQQALLELLDLPDLEWDGSEVGEDEGEGEGEQSSDESSDESNDEVTEDEVSEDEEDTDAAEEAR